MEPFYFVFATYEEAIEHLPKFNSDEGVALRQHAEDSRRREEESFQRSDTDGCVSQWCHSITAQEKVREAELRDSGSMIVRPALVDIESGQVVAACVHILQSKFHYGSDYVWKVHRNGRTEWVGDAKRESTFTKKGLRKVYVLAPGAMYARGPGNHLPEPRGLGGLASYSGKYPYFDYRASGLPL